MNKEKKRKKKEGKMSQIPDDCMGLVLEFIEDYKEIYKIRAVSRRMQGVFDNYPCIGDKVWKVPKDNENLTIEELCNFLRNAGKRINKLHVGEYISEHSLGVGSLTEILNACIKNDEICRLKELDLGGFSDGIDFNDEGLDINKAFPKLTKLEKINIDSSNINDENFGRLIRKTVPKKSNQSPIRTINADNTGIIFKNPHLLPDLPNLTTALFERLLDEEEGYSRDHVVANENLLNFLNKAPNLENFSYYCSQSKTNKEYKSKKGLEELRSSLRKSARQRY